MIYILVALAGVTGIGKSYYKDRIVEKLGFEKIKIITTRPPRVNEKNNDDKIFVSKDELDKMCDNGEIAYKFELLGVSYAYTKDAVFSNKNTVFEMHYSNIEDWKKICPELQAIYLFPKDINVSKEKLCERHLAPEVQKARLLEIDEHYNRMTKDKELIKKFDYILYNNYDEESENEVIDLVRKLIE